MTSLPDVLVGLNEEQLEVALCKSSCMVIAGPGSGKTNTVARKAALLLTDRSRRVAAVTFTREAAIELRERIIRHAGMEAAPRLLVGTFHSTMQLMAFPHKKVAFGSEILRSAKSGFGSTPWNIVKEGFRRSYILRAMTDLGVDMELEDASRIIEQIKSGKAARELIHEKLTHAYMEIMERNNVIDFQDILLRTNEGLREGHVSPLNVTDLFIDEYQDTDETQFDWARVHHQSGIVMNGVGDDDQSIYAFRNALGYEGMLRFISMFGAQKLRLDRNYRSHSEILDASVRVIGHNLGRIDKDLKANKGPGGAVRWRAFKSREDEAFAAVTYGADALAAGKSIGILARNNRRLDLIEASLLGRDLPYTRPPGESFMNRPEVAIFGAALRYIIAPTPRGLDALLSWNGVSEDDLRAIHKAFGDRLVLGSAEDYRRAGVSDDAKTKWRAFVRLCEGWQRALGVGTENLVIQGVYEWLVGSAADPATEKRLAVAREIYVPRPEDKIRKREAQTIRQRLEALERQEKQRKEKAESNAPVIDLMTAHGSKGLERDWIWILGVEDESFPAKDGGLEEERRLMYVAMTRARQDLTISTGGGKPPSPFINESGVQRVDFDEPRREAA